MVSDQQSRSKRPLRVLIVDDNQDAADTMGRMLRFMGNTVRIVHDGEQALSGAAEFQPDLLLLDLGLPKLNGYDVCRRIRQQPGGMRMIIVAVTGWDRDEDCRRTTEAGFDYHWVKPVNPATLRKLLADIKGKLPA